MKKLVDRKVHKTIHELGGTIPENLLVAESTRKIEAARKSGLRPDKLTGEINHGWTPTCRDEREHGG